MIFMPDRTSSWWNRIERIVDWVGLDASWRPRNLKMPQMGVLLNSSCVPGLNNVGMISEEWEAALAEQRHRAVPQYFINQELGTLKQASFCISWCLQFAWGIGFGRGMESRPVFRLIIHSEKQRQSNEHRDNNVKMWEQKAKPKREEWKKKLYGILGL